MRRLFHILYLTLFILLISGGCRCLRGSYSSMESTTVAGLDARSRSLSLLWDTLAERQTIRIEYYYPYNIEAFAPADTTDTASTVGSARPSGTGGGVPAVRTVEIETERSSGRHQTSVTDSIRHSQTSSRENLQEERTSETRWDKGTVAIVAVAAAAVALIIALTLIKKILG